MAFGTTVYDSCPKGLVWLVRTSFSLWIPVVVSVVACPLCAAWAITMVKLSEIEAKQRLQRLFEGGRLPSGGALFLLWFVRSTLGINDYLVTWIWKQSVNRDDRRWVLWLG